MSEREKIVANIIRFNNDTSADDWLSMSNGLTDVFISAILLSGSEMAQTEDEKQLIVWLSEKDQTIGMGTVGFDIVEIPWNKNRFEEEKRFLIKVIESAEQKSGWQKLDYVPNEKLIIPSLNKFKEYIVRMTEDYVNENKLIEWLKAAESDDPVNCGFPRCKKHNTLLTFLGCQICNS